MSRYPLHTAVKGLIYLLSGEAFEERAHLRMSETAFATKDDLRLALKAKRNERVAKEIPHTISGAWHRFKRRWHEYKIQRRIAQQLLRYPPSSVAAYIPLPGEIDLSRLMRRMHARGWQIALPCIESSHSHLIFRRWYPGVELVQGSYGIWQPSDRELQITPGAVLLPLLGFDRFGHRIGMGKGWYDRTLNALRSNKIRPLTLGVAYDEQEINFVPIDGNDQPMQGIITPTRVVDCSFYTKL